jgi:hypothetical protein
MPKWGLVLASLVCCAKVASAGESALIADDFSSANPKWAFCGPSGSKGFVSGGSLNLKVSSQSSFSSAAYLPFETVALADGQTLRLTVDVSTDNADKKTGDLRMGLGYANPVIVPGANFKVGISGYYITAPSGGQVYNVAYKWHDASENKNDFLFAATSSLGGQVNQNSVSSKPVAWILEITRAGNNLEFSGSLAGKKFSRKVVAEGANVISSFQFNTVALGYLYARGQTASYDNLKVELLTP